MDMDVIFLISENWLMIMATLLNLERGEENIRKIIG